MTRMIDASKFKPGCRYMIEVMETTGDDMFKVTSLDHDPRKTPNCAICRWNAISSHHIRNEHWTEPNHCSAQGNKKTYHCYNSPQCQQLFEPEQK